MSRNWSRGLREKLDNIGAVNADAIAEYEALEERHNFLETQNSDLVAAKKELLNIIGKINATSRDLFAETFERVRVNFQEMFTELFGGGKANLRSRQRSKTRWNAASTSSRVRPASNSRASRSCPAAEKTMTAVALLFAVYMVKPSPFCVLDEMDAPLDESNIGALHQDARSLRAARASSWSSRTTSARSRAPTCFTA